MSLAGDVKALVDEFVGSNVPAPRVAVVADEWLVAGTVQGSFLGGDAYHGVSASLAVGPRDFPEVDSGREADLASDAVCRLGHRVSVDGEDVVVLDENVQGAVFRIPRVSSLRLQIGPWLF